MKFTKLDGTARTLYAVPFISEGRPSLEFGFEDDPEHITLFDSKIQEWRTVRLCSIVSAEKS